MLAFGGVFFFLFCFCHFDPPLSHPPGAVWSHTVAFPRLAAATAGTRHNQRREEGRSAGTVITVTAGGGALLRDSRREVGAGGGNHLTPSVFSCGFTHRHLQSGPRRKCTVHPVYIPRFLFHVTFRKQTLQRGEEKKEFRLLTWARVIHAGGGVSCPRRLGWTCLENVPAHMITAGFSHLAIRNAHDRL